MLPKFSTLLECLRTLSSRITLGFAVLFLAAATVAPAQTTARPIADRLLRPIDDKARVTLGNTIHPLANRANDRGAVADGMKLDRLQIVLKRSDEQEADLKQLIADMHTPGSAGYHKWLTPDDFGKRFGPSDADVAKLTSWLQSHGFNVTKLNPGRQTLEFSGSAGQFRDTFKAQVHTFQVQGENRLETHYANAADPQIPAALAPIFGGFASLNNFRFKRNSHRLGTASYNPVTHANQPDWTIGGANSYNLVLSPADFAVQYALPSQATAGTNDGTGQSIAIVNEANINISLVNRFRTLFGLPSNPPQVIIDGNDPGIDGINNPDGENGATGEAYLDVEWAGAVAPAATVNLVIGADTALENGLAFAAERAVYSNISPVVSVSFSNCEASLQSGNAFFSGLWEQAAAQGITVVVSTGDDGSANCDGSSGAYAVNGQAVSGIASTPYNVAVGGTDFYYAGGSSDFTTYWNTTPSNAAPKVSLLKRVPEQPWNDSQYGLDILSYYQQTGNTTIAAGSGGASTLGLGTPTTNGTNYGPYPKPSWQKGTGVPADSARDIPDVSLFASDGSNNTYYPICAKDGDCQPVAAGDDVQISGVGGTSASTPSFAGIMALVNQQYGRQGQAGFVLYPLAAQFPTAFNDITVGTNTVPCAVGTVDCQTVPNPLTGDDPTNGSSSEGEIGLSAGNAAYNAGTGYDLATGLGSVNVSNLLADWSKVTFAATTVTLAPSVTTFAHGTAVTISGKVTGTGTPTGDVALLTDSTTQAQAGQTFFTLSGGNFSNSVSFLPGGTYNIWGNYGGDSANASSSSIANKVQVTVTPEASTTALHLYSGYDNSGNPLTAPASVLYGTQVLVSAQPAPKSGSTSDSLPTGSVAFTDGGTALNTASINAEGDAEYYTAYTPGSHTITAAYSGDASYTASTSAAIALTVTANTPTFVGPTYSNLNSAQTSLLPGQQSLIVAVANSDAAGNLVSSPNAAAPAGTLSLTGGPSGITTSVNLVPGVDLSSGAAEGIGTFIVPASASGNYTLTFTYTPSNSTYYKGVTGSIQVSFNSGASGLLASTTTATATPNAATPAGALQLTTTVAGPSGKPAPSGTITFYSSEVSYGSFTLPTGTGNSTVATVLFDSAGLLQGTNQITVQYSGDANYLPSAGVVNVLNPLSDFQLVPLATLIPLLPNNTATETINLASTNSFAGTVSFTCKGAGGITCSLSPASATLAAGGQGAVTLNLDSSAVTRNGTYNVVVTGSDSTGNYVHTLGFQAVVTQVTTAPSFAETGTAVAAVIVGNSSTSTISTTPAGGFTGTVALTCAVTGPTGATSLPTCSLSPASVAITGATAVTSTLTVATTSTTTAGSYSVKITGTSGSATQSVTLPLVVNAVSATPTFTLTGLMNEGATAGTAPTSTVTATPGEGFSGSVALTCAVTGPTGATDVPTCALVPTSVSLSTAAVSSTLTVTTQTATTPGDYSITVTGTSGTTVVTESFVLTVTAAAGPGGIMVAATSPITVVAQGSSATSTVTVTPSGGFAGSVALSCAITASPSGASELPTCSLAPPSVTISGGAATSTLTVSTTAQTTTGSLKMLFPVGGGITLAALFLIGGPLSRKGRLTMKAVRTMRLFTAAALFAIIAAAVTGCGSGSHSSGGGGGTPVGGTTTGSYTVTLTATPTPTGGAAGTPVTTTVALTVN